MSSLAIRCEFEDLRTLAFGAISGTYAGVGSPFSHAVRLLFIVNETDVGLTVSFNGVNDQLYIPASGFFLFDVTANKSLGQGLFITEGKRVYVKGSPTSGSVYVSVAYGTIG